MDEKSQPQPAPQEPSLHSDDDAGYSHSDPPFFGGLQNQVVDLDVPVLKAVEDDNHNDLHGNPDALEWANRFCMIHAGKMIQNQLDEGSYFGIGSALPWFAGAIETGRMIGTQQFRGAQLYEVEGSYHVDEHENKVIVVWVIARSNAEAREAFMEHCRQSKYQGPLFRKATVRSTGHMPLVVR